VCFFSFFKSLLKSFKKQKLIKSKIKKGCFYCVKQRGEEEGRKEEGLLEVRRLSWGRR
jgi:hypothetical protein